MNQLNMKIFAIFNPVFKNNMHKKEFFLHLFYY
jgi:hypothetical protein